MAKRSAVSSDRLHLLQHEDAHGPLAEEHDEADLVHPEFERQPAGEAEQVVLEFARDRQRPRGGMTGADLRGWREREPFAEQPLNLSAAGGQLSREVCEEGV